MNAGVRRRNAGVMRRHSGVKRGMLSGVTHRVAGRTCLTAC